MGRPASALAAPMTEAEPRGMSIFTMFVLGLALLMGIHTLEGPVLDAKAGTVHLAAQEGLYSPKEDLKLDRLFEGQIKGPETVLLREDGLMIALIKNGSIAELDVASNTVNEWAYTGGRCLGGAFDKNGDLIAAQVTAGLIKVDKTTRQVTVLANIADGKPIRYADDVSISAQTGNIYFSDASAAQPTVDMRGDIDLLYSSKIECISLACSGRLLEYNPETRTTTVLIDDLCFGNGVVVSSDGTFVLVNESCSATARRYWLSGPKKGTWDYFMNHVGLPDGVSAGVDEKGEPIFYFVLFSPFPGFMLGVLDWPSIRQLLLYLPSGLSVPILKWGFIVRTDKNGVVTRTWQDHSGETFQLTAVEVTKGGLYVGGLHNNFVGFLKIDK